MGDYALRFNAARIEVEELTEENRLLRDALEDMSQLLSDWDGVESQEQAEWWDTRRCELIIRAEAMNSEEVSDD